jgi:tetratricopeptide (TPR) repeat protein
MTKVAATYNESCMIRSLTTVLCGALLLGAAVTESDLDKARDAQDRAALERSIAELQKSAQSSQATAQAAALCQLATAYSYAAEVSIEVKDKSKAQGFAEAGIEAMKKALESSPNNAEYHRLLGELCGQVIPANALMGALKYGQCARDEINKAIELDPKNALAYVSRGVGNYYLPPQFGGSLDAAIKDFDKAISLNPKLAEAYLWKGIALRKANQHAAAHQSLEMALKLNPNSLWTRQQLEKTPAQ